MGHNFYQISIILAAITIMGVACSKQDSSIVPVNGQINSNTEKVVVTSKLLAPIADALNRVTKKPFGIKVSPKNSPVEPERFSGYHTGVDFEILPGEENTEVKIFSVCTGNILEKRWVSGYGGVLVQGCQLNNQDITVVYGHLKLISIAWKIGNELSAGSNIGVLGDGYSQETDKERKHLHLGIHKGKEINLRGYVDSVDQLNNWIDSIVYLKN